VCRLCARLLGAVASSVALWAGQRWGFKDGGVGLALEGFPGHASGMCQPSAALCVFLLLVLWGAWRCDGAFGALLERHGAV
jgi:hypothetical protein